VVIRDCLLIYYCVADMVTCVASAKLVELLNRLVGVREAVTSAIGGSPVAVDVTSVGHV
jgi:hypothetical protein